MNENLQNVWVLGSSQALVFLAVLQIIDVALTLLHSLQERKGQLWRYFGAIAGVEIPDRFGQIAFFAGLTVSLWIVGLLGIAGTVLWQTPLAFGCLGAIIGCRISDSVFSRILLNNAGYRPNPGLPSVPFYFIDAAVLAVVFCPTLLAQAVPVLTGFIIGALVFYSVIPGLRIIGPLAFERITPWEKGRPQPTGEPGSHASVKVGPLHERAEFSARRIRVCSRRSTLRREEWTLDLVRVSSDRWVGYVA